MFELSLSIRLSLLHVQAGRMPRRCSVTLPHFEEKRSPWSIFSFVVVEAAVWRKAWSDEYLFGLIGVKCRRTRKIPVNSSRLVLWKKCIVICGCMRCLPAFNVTQNHWRRRYWKLGWLGYSDWGLYSSSGSNKAIVANSLNGLVGNWRSLRFGGLIGCWRPY